MFGALSGDPIYSPRVRVKHKNSLHCSILEYAPVVIGGGEWQGRLMRVDS